MPFRTAVHTKMARNAVGAKLKRMPPLIPKTNNLAQACLALAGGY